MKSRPDVTRFKANPSAFLVGAAEPTSPAPVKAPKKAKEKAKEQLEIVPKVATEADSPKTEQKGFRLRLETIANIEREVYARRVKGDKITQTELVEQALADFFKALK